METDSDRALRYRARAEQIRNRAKTLTDPAARRTLRTLAKDYDELAASCEQPKARKARR